MTSTTTKLNVRKVTERIGAEGGGVDLAGESDADTVAAIRVALNEHEALAFQDVSSTSPLVRWTTLLRPWVSIDDCRRR